MRYVTPARIGMPVSRIGFGCASFWCKPVFPQSEAVALVHAAIEAGVRLFDTGDSYGRGLAETRLGAALAGKPTADLLIATKTGTRYDARGRRLKDFSPAWMRQSVEESLRRLRVAQIGLLQLHEPAPHQLTDETFEALAALRQAGKVRAVGVSAFNLAAARRAVESGAADALMVDYNLLRRDRAPLIAQAAAHGMLTLAAQPLINGLASPALLRPGLRNLWYMLRAAKNYRLDVLQLRKLAFLRHQEGWSTAQLAMGYVLAHPQLGAAVFNTTRLAHLHEILAVAERPFPPELLTRIEAL